LATPQKVRPNSPQSINQSTTSQGRSISILTYSEVTLVKRLTGLTKTSPVDKARRSPSTTTKRPKLFIFLMLKIFIFLFLFSFLLHYHYAIKYGSLQFVDPHR